MTACFWADEPLEPSANDAEDDESPRPRCPRCDTPVLVVTCLGPTEHVATPCGCRVPGDLLEQDGNASD